MAKQNFQVDLRGIVEILSHHLYSSPRVYVRELIQNARDAIVARELESGAVGLDATREQHRAPIEIIIDETERSVIVRDYGIGLTEEDALTLLSTIGASSKHQDLASARRDYLGQFGIGLLSCFLVSDEIDVRSRSARLPASPTMQWRGYGDGTFTVGEAADPLAEPGTEVRVRARPDDSGWATTERVRLLAERFAQFLSIPITVRAASSSAAVPVSGRTRPWDLDPAEASEWCRGEFGFTPLGAIPLDVLVTGVQGIAFISGSEGSQKRVGDFVLSRGMFVADGNTQLVPHWARFARVVLEAGDLPLTASRESLQDTAVIEGVRDEIGSQIRLGIERFSASDPDAFAEFLNVHAASLRGMAAEDAQMLDFVARHLRWHTSRGLMRLVDMPKDTEYAVTEGDFNAYAPLMVGRSTLLVNAAYTDCVKVLRAYDAAQVRMRVRRFDAQALLRKLPQPDRSDADLAQHVRHLAVQELDAQGVAVEVRAFHPASVMSLHVLGTQHSFAPDETADDPWASMLGDLALPDAADDRPKLVLNLTAPAVRALRSDLDSGTAAHAVQALHLLSLLQAGIRLSIGEPTALAESLQKLVTAAARTQ